MLSLQHRAESEYRTSEAGRSAAWVTAMLLVTAIFPASARARDWVLEWNDAARAAIRATDPIANRTY